MHSVSLDGSGDRTIPIVPGTAPQGPRPSPDGSRIAYLSLAASQAGISVRLAVMRTDGSAPLVLSQSGGFNPARSPDSRSLLFSSVQGPFGPAATMGVSVINADGTGLVELSKGLPSAQYAAWSPDGKHIVYSVLTPMGSAHDHRLARNRRTSALEPRRNANHFPKQRGHAWPSTTRVRGEQRRIGCATSAVAATGVGRALSRTVFAAPGTGFAAPLGLLSPKCFTNWAHSRGPGFDPP